MSVPLLTRSLSIDLLLVARFTEKLAQVFLYCYFVTIGPADRLVYTLLLKWSHRTKVYYFIKE